MGKEAERECWVDKDLKAVKIPTFLKAWFIQIDSGLLNISLIDILHL